MRPGNLRDSNGAPNSLCYSQCEHAMILDSTFDSFFADAPADDLEVTAAASISSPTRVFAAADTPESFEAKRRRLQVSLHRSAGRPPD